MKRNGRSQVIVLTGLFSERVKIVGNSNRRRQVDNKECGVKSNHEPQ